jgi:hypothetical protein
MMSDGRCSKASKQGEEKESDGSKSKAKRKKWLGEMVRKLKNWADPTTKVLFRTTKCSRA